MGSLRIKRLGSLIQNELSIILDRKVKDPRKKMITITEVRLNEDGSVARVFFTSLGDESQKEEALRFLEHIKSFLRAELKSVLKIRMIPELRFEIDNTFEYGQKIEKLLEQIHREDGSKAKGDLDSE